MWETIAQIVGAVLLFLGGAGFWRLVQAYLSLRGGLMGQSREQRVADVDEFKQVIQIQRADIDEIKAENRTLRQQVGAIQDELSQCETRSARQEAKVEYQSREIKALKDALAGQGIPFRQPPRPADGSDVFRPLPPGSEGGDV